MFLLKHQYKSYIRNQIWRKNLFSKILMSLMYLYLGAMLIMIGLYFGDIYAENEPDVIGKFNSYLIAFLVFDFMIRSQIQTMPAVRVMPYLRFNIRKSYIIKYFMSSPLWNIINFYPFAIILPFAIKTIMPALGLSTTLFYLLASFLFIILNSYLSMFINFKMQKNFAWYFIPFSVFTLTLLSIKTAYSTYAISTALGKLMLQGNPFLFLALIIAIPMLVLYIYKLFSSNFYVDEMKTQTEKKGIFSVFKINRDKPLSFVFLEKYGEIGNYMSLEIRLILRNTRTKGIITSSFFFIIYFIVMSYFNDKAYGVGTLSLFMCLGVVLYGSNIFSWESTYFDGLIARKQNFQSYVKAKYYLMICLALISFIIFSIYLSIKGQYNFFLLASFLFYICGVIGFFTLFFATSNDYRLDLNIKNSFSFNGFKLSLLFSLMLYFVYPMLAYKGLSHFFSPVAGYLAVAIPGIIFIISHNIWIKKIIIPEFIDRKYRNLEGFRKLSQ